MAIKDDVIKTEETIACIKDAKTGICRDIEDRKGRSLIGQVQIELNEEKAKLNEVIDTVNGLTGVDGGHLATDTDISNLQTQINEHYNFLHGIDESLQSQITDLNTGKVTKKQVANAVYTTGANNEEAYLNYAESSTENTIPKRTSGGYLTCKAPGVDQLETTSGEYVANVGLLRDALNNLPSGGGESAGSKMYQHILRLNLGSNNGKPTANFFLTCSHSELFTNTSLKEYVQKRGKIAVSSDINPEIDGLTYEFRYIFINGTTLELQLFYIRPSSNSTGSFAIPTIQSDTVIEL